MSRRVALLVPDLLFRSRIEGTAAQAGVAVTVLDPGSAVHTCGAEPPDLVVIDLAGPGDPIRVARALRASPWTTRIPVVGFYPHVDQALRVRALAAGVPHVLPRSAFVSRLAEILQGAI